jgi:hypothetical protein
MQNTLIGGLLLFGGILVSLGNNKMRGSICLMTLLLIVSLSIVISLQPSNTVNENFETTVLSQQQAPQQQQAQMVLPQQMPMPLIVPVPQAIGQQQPQQQQQQMPMPVPQQQPQQATVLKGAPNPPFNKIMGKVTNTIENVLFYDNNNNIMESGSSNKGNEFSFQCPDGQNIAGYAYNNEGRDPVDTSIFGGMGPVYCVDGTIVGTSVGKASNATAGSKPQTNLSKFNYVDNKVLPFDNNMLGMVNESSPDQCAFVCDYLKDNCGGFTYSNSDKKCGLVYSVDKTKLVNGSNGRTYMKLPNK